MNRIWIQRKSLKPLFISLLVAIGFWGHNLFNHPAAKYESFSQCFADTNFPNNMCIQHFFYELNKNQSDEIQFNTLCIQGSVLISIENNNSEIALTNILFRLSLDGDTTIDLPYIGLIPPKETDVAIFDKEFFYSMKGLSLKEFDPIQTITATNIDDRVNIGSTYGVSWNQ